MPRTIAPSRFRRRLPLCRFSWWICFLALAGACARSGNESVPAVTSQEAKVAHYGTWAPVPDGPPLRLLLITLDTTKRDHLSCYAPERAALTPNLQALAADAVVFDHAVSSAPITLPSHATVLTGLYPYRHGVRNNGTYVLQESPRTVAETLRDRGYETGAILGAFPVAKQFGLDQGFDHYDDRFPVTSVIRESDTAQRRADAVTRLGLEWLGTHRDSPTFLWLHYFDPHFPYDPPEAQRAAHPNDPYAGEVAFMDAELGRLFEGMKALGIWEETAILIVADHGESLGEHRERTHSLFIYGATQRVPMILRLPARGDWTGSAWRGSHVSALVTLADAAPTLLNIAGVRNEERPPMNGMSLLPIVRGEAGHAWVYLETLVTRLEYGLAELRGLETNRWKYIRAPQEELYDLAKDPGELQNLASKRPEIAQALSAALDEVLKQETGSDAAQVRMDRETIEKLRSLGYVAAGEMPAPTGELRDPKEMIEALDRIDYARALAADNRPEEALALVDSVLSKHPTDPTALRMRGSFLVRLGRGEEAIAVFDALISGCQGRCPDEFELQCSRAMASLAAGKLDDALERTRALTESGPDEPGIFLLLGQVLERSGDLPGARRAIDEQLRRTPDASNAWIRLAELEVASGNRRDAEEVYRRVLTTNPTATEALIGLGELLLADGRTAVARGYFDQALAADPSQPAALFRKAWFLRQDGRRDEAQRYYQLALQRDPTNQLVLYNLGNIFLEKGDIESARRLYDAALSTGAPSVGLLMNLGTAHARLRQQPQARAAWERALTLGPTPEEARTIRGNLRAMEEGR